MSRNTLLLLAFLGSTLTLAGAFFFQYVVGILPCQLCFLQRWPHLVMALLALIALVVPGRIVPVLGALTALVSIGFGVYHSGVERKFWAGPANCTGGQNLSGLSGSDLLSTDFAVATVMCDEISFEILGLTFANLNVLGSLVFLAIWIGAIRQG